MNPARHLVGAGLASALIDTRQRTWSLVSDLSSGQWLPPMQRGVNPVAWELAHLAWFAEFWILRGPHGRSPQGFGTAARPALIAGPDHLFDSARLAHAARWTEPMPNRAELQIMLQRQLDACLDALPPTGDHPDQANYFHRLALFHEDMHAEAFCWMRSALGYAAPTGVNPPKVSKSAELGIPKGSVDAETPNGISGFIFDNELPRPHNEIEAFSIDSAPVSAGDFAQFADAGGYDQPDYWPGDAGIWRKGPTGRTHPQNWRRDKGSGWQVRWYDQWLPMDPSSAVIHVNAFEAEAYCLWAGRRLPHALEWERAARTNPGFVWGHSVWEWMANPFVAYPGFTAGPYREYSLPWFGDHREMRGGAYATQERMHDVAFRNFFQPHRSDVFAGFRTAGARA